jgi:hypothetical protein
MIYALYLLKSEPNMADPEMGKPVPVKFWELQNINTHWTAYLTIFGNMPATLHFSRDEAMRFLDILEVEQGMDVSDVVIQPVKLPPMSHFAKHLLDVHERKEVNLEFRGESK